jgi:hypothetical protein
MNIFFVDSNPNTAAIMLADQHICKMQIESAQMCCTAHWETGSEAPYKRAHKNHPSTIWTRNSINHYRWLVEHGLEICKEFEKRYGKKHKTEEVLLWCKNNEPNILDKGFTEPPQCMPVQYMKEDTIEAYRTFYKKEKVEEKGLSWKKLNNAPNWL